MELNELISEIGESALGVSMSGRYTNTLTLNGFILQKPKFIKNVNRNNESCSFIIYQISRTIDNQTGIKSFNAITYLPKVVEKMKEVKTCCFITCFCRLEWTPKLRSYNAQMYECDITCEMDYPLLGEYKNGN